MLRLDAIQPRGLEPITFEIGDGECLAITGPSGAGKTVLLRAIVDLDESGGDADAGGICRSQTRANAWRRQVAYVPAESGWWADTVADHLPDNDICRALLRALGLPEDSLTWAVSRLSTGEKQRLALARALVHSPHVLLLDEPTSALDADATAAVEAVLKTAMRSGNSVVIVTHDDAQAERLGARKAVICNGRFQSAKSQAQP